MIGFVGVVLVFAMVFGGYLASGGKMDIILKSLPYELTIIGGAAIGAFIISNNIQTIRNTLKDIRKVFGGGKWKRDDYRDLLCLLSELIRVYRSNPVELEAHIDDPASSPIFERYPRLAADAAVIDLISDTLRSASMNYDDPHQVEEILEKRIESFSKSAHDSSYALQSMADGLPALGIVAAVLGVIKTMASIDQPPEILGKLIGGALVGTFLGVFLAYGIVGPFATRLKAIAEEDEEFYCTVKEVLVACMHNHPANICLEVGRQNTSDSKRPTFNELEEAVRQTRQAA